MRSARDAEDTAERKGKRDERDARRNGNGRRRPTELDENDAFTSVRCVWTRSRARPEK
jgi:hypothetical protein